MKFSYYTVDVFTDQLFGGNPLAVFPETRGLNTTMMQQIAREFNLSETVFVTARGPGLNTYTIRIFTPQTELPFAGHPTIGSAFVLGHLRSKEQPVQLLFKEKAGDVPIQLDWRNPDHLACRFTVPGEPSTSLNVPSKELLAELLGLTSSDIGLPPFRPALASAGVPFCIIPVRSEKVFSSLKFNHLAWHIHFKGTKYQHIYPVVYTDKNAIEWRVRMFAPGLGVPEDPATGAAAAALGGYLSAFHPDPVMLDNVTVLQGREMGRPSHIQVSVTSLHKKSPQITIAGAVHPVSSGTFYLNKNEWFV